MAKFTFTRDYMERQPGPKRRYKAWKANHTYTMTKEHARQLEEQSYGYCNETNERFRTEEGPQGADDPLA